MNKIAILITLLFASGWAALTVLDNWGLDQLTSHQPDLGQDDLQERWIRYRLFKQTLDASVNALANRQLSIQLAHERVLVAALEYQPEYVKYLAVWEIGATTDERIVNNLIGHATFGSDAQTQESFDREAQAYLGTLRKRMP